MEPAEDTRRCVARVAVDKPLAHLDHLFDYAIPDSMRDDVVPGVRVRVRFGHELLDGWVIEVVTSSSYSSDLVAIQRLISPEPVLFEPQVRLMRAVANHYAGHFADVVRLALPPRHASTEKAKQREWKAPITETMPGGGLVRYRNGERFLSRISAGDAIRAFWQVSPHWSHDDWTRGIVQACVATLRAGSDAIVVVANARQLSQLQEAMADVIGRGRIAVLHSDLGRSARYRNYLAISRGQAHVVIGTRPAVYAPVHKPGLICLWDDGDDQHSDRHAPYPHARDVAAIRAAQDGCGLLYAGYSRSTEIQRWIERGWCAVIDKEPREYRRECCVVRAAVDSNFALQRDPVAQATRLPSAVFDTIRAGLLIGPVLVQVPRAGYIPALLCSACRTPARCSRCHGPVERNETLSCRWCGKIQTQWQCPECGATALRAAAVGALRTREELGRAFPGIRVVDSGAGRIPDDLPDEPLLVVATVGAEPHVPHGYAAAVLLDADRLLYRADMRAGEEALRRWLGAVSLVRSAEASGTCTIVGPSDARAVQAFIRLDAAGFAARELADRREAGLPPAAKFIAIEGRTETVTQFVGEIELPAGAERLGIVELDDESSRAVVRSSLEVGAELTRCVRSAYTVRSMSKRRATVRVRVDPMRL